MLTRRNLLHTLGGAAVLAAGAAPARLLGLSSPMQVSHSGSQDAAGARSLVKYFASTAPQLLRPAQGSLRHPSIAPSLPGKTYSAELWDWDTLWTARGLFAYARVSGDAAFKTRVVEHAKGSLLCFLENQAEDGRLPIMINPKDRDFFHSFDPARNQAKPVMAQLALLIANEAGDAQWLASLLPAIRRFHASWLKTNLSPIGLLVWSNGIAIGNDNDPTVSGRPPFSSAHLLLNCLFWADLDASAQLAGKLGMESDRATLRKQADDFAAKIRAVLWDPRDSFFYSHDVQVSDDRVKYIPNIPRGMDFSYQSLPMRIAAFTGFLPLWCGIATSEQAGLLLNSAWRKDDRFRGHFGCRTLSRTETMYSMARSGNPSNWLGPIWIIANYLVWKALQRYGRPGEAEEIASTTIRMLAADLSKSGSLNEYYHPDTGAPLSHAGFMDWNLLVLEMIESLHALV